MSIQSTSGWTFRPGTPKNPGSNLIEFMKQHLTVITLLTVASVSSALCAANTGSPFYGDAPDDHHPWAVHDHNRPQPPLVTPGTFSSQEQPGKPPSDAIILFDGSDLSKR